MRTAKNLLPSRRQIFHPELLCCPHCGGELKLCNYLTWDKTVQTLSEVLSIASRPSHCVDANCAGFLQRFVSAEGQQIALPGSTYGLDVVVRIGWLRQEGRYTFAEIQGLLAGTIQISLTHLRHIYQRVYLPLLACDERQHKDKLEKLQKNKGGLS